MQSRRLYRINLSNDLSIKGCGAFGNEDAILEWSQPAGNWQALLMHHRAILTLNGEQTQIEPWSLIVVPPGARCHLSWKGKGPFVYNYFGFAVNSISEGGVAIPLVKELGSTGHFWDIEFRKGLDRLPISGGHVGAVARAMLWSVSQPASVLRRNVYVAEAERLIGAETGPRLKVSELAASIGLSQAQLNRLFLVEHGMTPLQFIRTEQAHRAQRLLSTTVQPIKSVAIDCGFPNLHSFNRFVRSRLGAAPREIRAGMGTVDVFRIEEYRARTIE